MNTANHLVCSAIFRAYEPGIVTSLLLINIAYRVLKIKGLFAKKSTAVYSILSGLMYWVLPMIAFVGVDRILSK